MWGSQAQSSGNLCGGGSSLRRSVPRERGIPADGTLQHVNESWTGRRRLVEAHEQRHLLDQVMSAYAPNIGDGPTQRHHQDHWQPAGSNYTPDESPPAQSQSSNGITDKVSGFFGADRREELPMYKDKPTRGGKGKYAYPGNLKKAPWFKQRRTVAVALTSLAAVSWWFGILSPLLWVTSGGASRSVPSMRGWEARAEQVRETFRVSFAGYEKNAWGMCRGWLPYMHGVYLCVCGQR